MLYHYWLLFSSLTYGVIYLHGLTSSKKLLDYVGVRVGFAVKYLVTTVRLQLRWVVGINTAILEQAARRGEREALH